MLTTLVGILVLALVLVVIYYVVSMFLSGRILQIVGLICGLILLIYALSSFGVLPR